MPLTLSTVKNKKIKRPWIRKGIIFFIQKKNRCYKDSIRKKPISHNKNLNSIKINYLRLLGPQRDSII